MCSSDLRKNLSFINWKLLGAPFYKTELRDQGVMPIRMIAKELYLLVKEVEKIEKQLENAPGEKHAELKDQLRKAKAARNQMRNILEGKKG